MADTTFFPFESNFEVGTLAEWTSEVDTESKLSCDHYKPLVQQLGHRYRRVLPFRGSYCAHIDLSLGTADAYVQEDTGFDSAAATTRAVRLYFQVTSNLVMAAADYFTIFTLQSAGPVDEAVIGIVNNAGAIQVVAAETSALAAGLGAATRFAGLTLDQWHLLELVGVIDAGGGNDGTLAFYLDGYQIGANIATLDQGAIIQARLGAIGIDAGTTAGHLLFDQVVTATARIGGFAERYPQTVVLTKSGFVAQGAGMVESYTLVPGNGVDAHLKMYDLDRQPVLLGTEPCGPELGNDAIYHPETFYGSLYFQNGLYVAINGTAPRAMVTLRQGNVSEALIKQHAMLQKS